MPVSNPPLPRSADALEQMPATTTRERTATHFMMKTSFFECAEPGPRHLAGPEIDPETVSCYCFFRILQAENTSNQRLEIWAILSGLSRRAMPIRGGARAES